MAATTRKVKVKTDPDDDKHTTELEVQMPVPDPAERPPRAQVYTTAVHPDLGIEAVFAPGDLLPDWYTTPAELASAAAESETGHPDGSDSADGESGE
jgi:hypothetical protein